MTSRRTWPKADLLQQRRLALGLPLQPAPAPPLLCFLPAATFCSRYAGVVECSVALGLGW